MVYTGSLDGLSATPDWTFSVPPDHREPEGVAFVGDLDGDGHDELFVTVPWFDGGEANEGRALLFRGSPAGPSALPDWSFETDVPGGELGAVAPAGDLNGDGFGDLAVGAPEFRASPPAPQFGSGRVLVFHGSASGLAASPVT